MVCKSIKSLEDNTVLAIIFTLGGMQMLMYAWNAASIETIINCFRKVGISTVNQETATADKKDPFKDLLNEIDVLKNVEPDLTPGDINAALSTNFDTELSAAEPPLTD